jgi:hypothetical protein
MVENLVILNLPHRNGLAREMAGNEEQQRLCETFYLGRFRRSEYSRRLPMTAETSASCVIDLAAKQHYPEAFTRNGYAAC